MAENDTYVYETPEGHVLHIQAENEASAKAFADNWHESNITLGKSIKDIPSGFGYGLTKGLSNIGSALSTSAAHEMSQPDLAAEIPSGQKTFEEIQKNITGPLSPPSSLGGELSAKTGEMLAYNPISALTPGASTVGAGASAIGSEIGKSYGGPIGEFAGGVFGPAVVGNVARGLGKVAGVGTGMLTGTGGKDLSKAYQTGTIGGEAAQAFRENLRQQQPFENVVSDARRALFNLKQEREAHYNQAMDSMPGADKPISFEPIDAALKRMEAVRTTYGVSTSPSTQATRDLIRNTVEDWKAKSALDPRLQTVRGMDGLKKRISDIWENLPEETPQRAVAGQARHAVRDAISNAAPEYGKAMQAFEKETNQLDELKRTLSLGDRATIDTSLRKLQSTMRDNVNTNYGQRQKLVDVLEQHGAPNLTAALAGQSLSSIRPRGLANITDPMVLAAMGASAATLHPASLAALLLTPAMSPRVAGEAAHGLGRISGYFGLPEALQRIKSPSQMAQSGQSLLAQQLMRGQ